ncbi:hypothetical protein [Corynebacterium sp.]|uniref:PepSY domain-containing protein n=1 Tax=Corynebacterium sp. TaxID=1720 RepID=UPI0026E04763|nr:hypothetical protein [Corynebacterium sp.]MDO5511295.1 hypothetical protein [Corynebacterium sp.]
MTNRLIKTIAIAASAGLLVTACTDADDTATDDPGTVTTTTPAGEDPTETTVTTADTADQVEGEDPVFRVIDAVKADYPDAVIVDIDREDDADSYSIEAVEGEDVIELQVDFDGTLDERERGSDDETVRKSQDATVDVTDAINQALELHPEGLLDEVELDEDNDTLQWKVSLDDADRNDLAEVDVAAN